MKKVTLMVQMDFLPMSELRTERSFFSTLNLGGGSLMHKGLVISRINSCTDY
uniref:Uncharacterized protein n=1 Tax=Heterorhabditis bacteriophora TaxID=37862 RepID=A0A1I7WTZ0_HETBA